MHTVPSHHNERALALPYGHNSFPHTQPSPSPTSSVRSISKAGPLLVASALNETMRSAGAPVRGLLGALPTSEALPLLAPAHGKHNTGVRTRVGGMGAWLRGRVFVRHAQT